MAPALLLVVAGVVLPLGPAQAASACGTLNSASGYHVSICFDKPTDGSTLVGVAPVQVSVTTTGMPSGTRVQSVIFCRDQWPCSKRADGYLITDWSGNPDGSGAMLYTFDLDTRLYVDDPSATLYAYALVNDGSSTNAASTVVAFNNGVRSTPPLPTGFTAHVPSANSGLVVGAVGDGAGGEPGETSVASLVDSWQPGLFLYLGDLYNKGTPEEFNNWYDKYGYGALRPVTDPTIGNHEYSADGVADGYFGYWKSPPHYYSYNGGGWHFISLDSTSQFDTSVPGVSQDQPSTVPKVSTQYDWLAADLAAHKNACTIVYFHHPLFNQGEESQATRMGAIWSLLAANHVTAALTGHDHDYQRFAPLNGSGAADPRGVTEFVVGGGGHSTQQVVPGSQPGPNPVSYANGFGAMRLVLHPDRFDFTELAPDGTAEGKQLDSGSVPCQGLPKDTKPPTAPQASATASLRNNLPQVALSWTPSQDDRGVAAYDVLRGGTVIATLPSTATSYTDDSVRAATSYTYVVRARDAWNNKADSTPMSVTTPQQTADPTDAPLVADTYVASASPSPKGAGDRLRVLNSSSGTDVSYLKFDLSQYSGTIDSATLTLTPASNTSSTATARAVADTSWNEATLGWPGPALGASGGSTQGALQAGVPTSIDVTGLVTPGQVNSLALVETAGTATQSYYSKEGPAADEPRLTITMGVPPDTSPPTRPTGLAANAAGEDDIHLAWQPSTDNVQVDHYVIYRDGVSYDQVPASSTSYDDVLVSAGQSWHYQVSAVDDAGNESPLSADAVATTPDLTAPEDVEGTVALATSGTSALVTWDDADDNVGVTGYIIYRNGVEVGQVGAEDLEYSDTGLTPSTTYTYSVAAYDAAGNTSDASSAPAEPITTPASSSDTTPPSVPQDLDVRGVSGSSVKLTWDGSSDDVGVAGYTVFQDGKPAYNATSTTYQVDGLDSPSTHTWSVDAVDTSGNHSGRSTPVTFTTPDAVPPTAPPSLDVSATTYRAVSLTWPAATDNVGVTGYSVYRDGVLLNQVTDTSYTDKTASPSTSYTYAVAADDAMGNQSPPTQASFTTPASQTDDTGWLTVDDSGYVQSGTSADSNYRYSSLLRVVTTSSTQKVSYLRVTVPASVLPTLDHLYLQLTTQDAANPGFDVHPALSNAWDRTTLTWNNQPGWDPTVLASSGAVTQPGVVPAPPGTVDLASAISGPGTYSFVLVSNSSQSQTYESSYTSVPDTERPQVRWLSHD